MWLRPTGFTGATLADKQVKTQKTILSPSEFAWFQLGEKSLYDLQTEGLEAIGLQEQGGPPVGITTANGSGKTARLIFLLILWFLRKFPVARWWKHPGLSGRSRSSSGRP